ncbi:uncharacterized protein AB675_10156 [Cyphellophora attinorum]|uniref:Antigenic thaumatin-like protein n=1 Tax=Cyphellophora attinorum TaxID=1664694 RepID=A0A0N0NI94_9EURO|nr:uncharacterized protein AB675_10156 [Phialophora attinorum]KPI35169.1 hypothetical protein AB675_10156 [Phialophora attinorum]
MYFKPVYKTKMCNSQLALLTGLLALLISMPSASAASNAIVINQCGAPIYVASVKNNNNAQPWALPAGQRYTEPLLVKSSGVSIKVQASPGGKVAQFEFTLASDGKVYYDISNIDGNPFAAHGVSLVPSVKSSVANPTCVAVDCPPGARCDAAYNLPDDVRTKVCPGMTDLVFTLCTKSPLGGGGGATAGSAPAPAASTVSKSTVSKSKSKSRIQRRVEVE